MLFLSFFFVCLRFSRARRMISSYHTYAHRIVISEHYRMEFSHYIAWPHVCFALERTMPCANLMQILQKSCKRSTVKIYQAIHLINERKQNNIDDDNKCKCGSWFHRAYNSSSSFFFFSLCSFFFFSLSLFCLLWLVCFAIVHVHFWEKFNFLCLHSR